MTSPTRRQCSQQEPMRVAGCRPLYLSGLVARFGRRSRVREAGLDAFGLFDRGRKTVLAKMPRTTQPDAL